MNMVMPFRASEFRVTGVIDSWIIPDGRYYIVIEYEGTELDRFIVDFSSQYKSDLQKDIELQARAVQKQQRLRLSPRPIGMIGLPKPPRYFPRQMMLLKIKSMMRQQPSASDSGN